MTLFWRWPIPSPRYAKDSISTVFAVPGFNFSILIGDDLAWFVPIRRTLYYITEYPCRHVSPSLLQDLVMDVRNRLILDEKPQESVKRILCHSRAGWNPEKSGASGCLLSQA